jgi:prolipoprotein diacylglyceryltransferase
VNTWLLFQKLGSPFSLIMTLGSLIGLVFVSWSVSEKKRFYFDGGVAVLFFILLGARLDYVFFQRGLHLADLLKIPQVWLGGLGPVGGVSGGGIGLIIVSLVGKRSFHKLLDAYLPLWGTLAASLGLASIFGEMGYGPESNAWWAVPVQDEFGVFTSRCPIHLAGGLIAGSALIALAFLPQERDVLSPLGRRGSVGLLIFAVIFGAASAFRVDPGLFVWGLRWQTWACIFLALIAVILIIFQGRCGSDE